MAKVLDGVLRSYARLDLTDNGFAFGFAKGMILCAWVSYRVRDREAPAGL